MLKFSQLRDITGGELLSLATDNPVVHLITDSRKALAYDGSVFFAVYGLHHDGHQYIKSLYDVGIRQFVIEKPLSTQEFKGANFLKVKQLLLSNFFGIFPIEFIYAPLFMNFSHFLYKK